MKRKLVLNARKMHAFFAMLFWLYACLIYGLLNSFSVLSVLNRSILSMLILVCLMLSLYPSKWGFHTGLRHPIGKSILIYMSYSFFSLMLSLMYGSVYYNDLAKIILQCFIPMTFYFCFSDIKSWKLILYIIVLVTVINIVIGICGSKLFNIEIPYLNNIAERLAGYNAVRLNSLIGKSTILGYFSLIVFAAYIFLPNLRFGLFVIPLTFLGVIFSLQRGIWVGLIIIAVFKSIEKYNSFLPLNNIWRPTVNLKKIILVLTASFLLMSFFFYHSDRFATHLMLINNRIENFTLKRLFENRLYQIIIFNNYNSFNVLFGEGFGKYNPLTSSPGMKQPDAPYIMVYNEGGLIGILIFLNLFYQIFIYSLKNRNYFLLFVVTHFTIEMVGSRILWNFPINYLFYSLIGMFQIVSSRKVTKGKAEYYIGKNIAPIEKLNMKRRPEVT